MASMTFLIIDDHPIFSQALVALLGEAFPGSSFLTAGTLDKGRELLLTCQTAPLVLLDVHLPDSKGAHGARELLRVAPGLKIIVLSAEDAPDNQMRLLRAGVHGFLSKAVQPDLFIERLGDLIRTPIKPLRFEPVPFGEFDFLSERQKAVIIEMARGRSNKEIALSLGIGVETVKTHVSEIIRRLGVRNRAEAVRHYMMRGTASEIDD